MSDISNMNVIKEKKSRCPNLLLSQEELLAEQVKLYPSLYDKSDSFYKERDVVRNAWEVVSLTLDFVEW